MKDLDQFVVHEIAFSPEFVVLKGRELCLVPRDVLQRVARDFDITDVREEMRGRCKR